MRLACLTEDGDYVDIASAIVREPLVVRALLTDALFQCQAQLPDSLDYLRTEQAIRDYLQHFQGEQERYVKSYVLCRTLDQRIQKTPRADIIYQSFHYGGPLALVGIFYATLDAHRNPRNRETLDFFLNKASSESKLELIKRTSTFPCNSSVGSWLQRIFKKIEPDSQTLAYILRGLGAVNIPKELFRLVRMASFTWGPDGEIRTVTPRIIPLIQEEQIFEPALRNLENRSDETVWTAEAAKIVIHAFPKHSNIEPAEYHLLPQILNPRVMALFDSACLIQLSEVGLSASNFGERLWKYNAVTIATEAANILGEDSADRALLLALANVRKASLALLYEDPGKWQAKSISFPNYDDRSSAFSSKLLIVKAREDVGFNAIASASEHLMNFKPTWNGTLSTLRKSQNRRVAFMRAKILRFEGRFREAYEILITLAPPDSSVASLLAGVLCELGQCDHAIQELNQQLTITRHPKSVTRVRLALANAYLMKCMQVFQGQGRRLDWRSLQASRDIYEDLRAHPFPATYFGKIDHLSTLMGLAIADHLNGQVDNALKAWQAALAASQAFLLTGYTDMIQAYSTSELQIRRGASAQADVLGNYAKALFAKTGRQYHFAGIGSFWPDILNSWYAASGRQPVIPPRRGE
ncbi:hypothetical protein DL771_006613 [Monosporascus sp. 5C6A]|nr:hypothetical protein DL771_006613 [Monosporascus sp. 5C6A]